MCCTKTKATNSILIYLWSGQLSGILKSQRKRGTSKQPNSIYLTLLSLDPKKISADKRGHIHIYQVLYLNPFSHFFNIALQHLGKSSKLGVFYYYFLICTLGLDNKGIFLIIGKREFLSLISSCWNKAMSP